MNHSDYYIFFYNGETLTACIPQAESGIPVLEIARKDVPNGTPFWFLPVSQFPLLGTEFFSALEIDTNKKPDGYGIGPHRWFIEKAEKEISKGINVNENNELIVQMKTEVFQLEGVRL